MGCGSKAHKNKLFLFTLLICHSSSHVKTPKRGDVSLYFISKGHKYLEASHAKQPYLVSVSGGRELCQHCVPVVKSHAYILSISHYTFFTFLEDLKNRQFFLCK